MNLLKRFRAGLARTRENTIGRITEIFRSGRIDEEVLEELEDALLEADVGVDTVDELIEKIRGTYKNNQGSEKQNPVEILKTDLIRFLNNHSPDSANRFSAKPWVILLVGVNGSGKTTTAGKLALYFGLQGKRTVIAAADTFRAAAVEQVEEWAKRGNARLVKQKTGADPASVAFDAYHSAKARGEDILIVDTAGRLQVKQNLMQELGKIYRVLKKQDPSAPHETLLVLDATTGQNGLSQAEGFTSIAGGTGLIITKLDGTARGGIVVPIRRRLNLPVEFIGLGEGVDDLQPFDAETFVNAIMDN